jgi:hypothetical protein
MQYQRFLPCVLRPAFRLVQAISSSKALERFWGIATGIFYALEPADHHRVSNSSRINCFGEPFCGFEGRTPSQRDRD